MLELVLRPQRDELTEHPPFANAQSKSLPQCLEILKILFLSLEQFTNLIQMLHLRQLEPMIFQTGLDTI